LEVVATLAAKDTKSRAPWTMTLKEFNDRPKGIIPDHMHAVPDPKPDRAFVALERRARNAADALTKAKLDWLMHPAHWPDVSSMRKDQQRLWRQWHDAQRAVDEAYDDHVRAFNRQWHRNAVEYALQHGHEVPSKVLAEYPGLTVTKRHQRRTPWTRGARKPKAT